MKRKMHITVTLAAGLLLTAPVHAQTTRYVATTGTDTGACTEASSPCETISYALDQAGVGDVINIAVGAYTEPEGLEIDKAITLQGAGRDLPNATVIQAHPQPGEATSRVLTISGGFVVAISDLIIRNGFMSAGFGGGIRCDGCALTLETVAVSQNGTTSASGGGVFLINNASGTFSDVAFVDNAGAFGGGGLNVIESSAVLEDVVFEENSANPGSGGGMRLFGANVTLSSVEFRDNRAPRGGGLAAFENSTAELDNVTFSANRAVVPSDEDGGFGGAIYNSLSSVTFANGTLDDNVASRSGGGMYNRAGEYAFSNVTFSGNSAGGTASGDGGGGMYHTLACLGCLPRMTDVTFEGNTAHRGGGIWMDGGASGTALQNMEFIGNEADRGGGGVYAMDVFSSVRFTGVTFSGNTSGFGGGGMTIFEGGPVLENVTFSNNTHTGLFCEAGPTPPTCGGGGLNIIDSSPVLENATFSGNTSTWGGGGMANFFGNPVLTNVYFENNAASAQGASLPGGGMRNRGGSPILKNVRFVSNTASAGGGMANDDGTSLHMANAVFFDNDAQTGGAMANLDDSQIELVNATLSHNTAFDGGGIYSTSSSDVNLLNSIVWGNEASNDGNEIYNSINSTAELHYSTYADEEGDIVTGGGFFVFVPSSTDDPLFSDAENGLLRLQDGSPAIDAGDPDTDFSLFPANDDSAPLDISNNLRVFGDTIDRGAYEWQPLGEVIFQDRFED